MRINIKQDTKYNTEPKMIFERFFIKIGNINFPDKPEADKQKKKSELLINRAAGLSYKNKVEKRADPRAIFFEEVML